ncbi:hypothetical protein ACFX12_007172 [Malus domestica]
MSSPSKSPSMEPVGQSHPHHKAFVATITQQVASYNLSPKKRSPAQGDQGQFTPANESGASLTANVSAAADGADHDLSEDEANSFNNNLKKDQDEFFNSFPPGYRFNPFDGELIVHYLMKKVLDQPLPPNRIFEVNLYRHNPEVLAEKYEKYGEKEWYFFTPRDRKYRNGSRPKRAAGDGYWKATGADKEVKSSDGAVVGWRKALVFYRGKPPKGDKTNWIMHEFRVKDSPVRSRRGENDMRLDNWVLCRIYKKDKNGKRCDSRNHAEIISPFSHRMNDEIMEIEMRGDIVDPLPEYDPALEYDHKYSNKGYSHMASLPNICGGIPVNMICNNQIQSVDAASMNASCYANMEHSQPLCVRPPSMSSESVLGPYRYMDQSTILPDDMMFDMKGFGHSPYSTNNYPAQFSSLDHVFPYTE